MAEIVCIECKSSVSDESGYCPECGYPFDTVQPDQNSVVADDSGSVVANAAESVVANVAESVADDAGSVVADDAESAVADKTESVTAADANSAPPNTIVTTPMDIILGSLNSVGMEIKELRSKVNEIKQDVNSRITSSEESTQNMLTAIAGKLDAIVAANSAREKAAQTEPPKKTKKELLAVFYKTLNSPNSMFEYMFYICLVQIVFVIVNLFLVAYIVTLVRE